MNENQYKSSGLQSSVIIKTGAGQFGGVLIITNGSVDASVIIYDALSATGTELFKGTVAAASNFGSFFTSFPVKVKTGIYIAVTGTGAKAIVYYR
jgi:hypothetical protein